MKKLLPFCLFILSLVLFSIPQLTAQSGQPNDLDYFDLLRIIEDPNATPLQKADAYRQMGDGYVRAGTRNPYDETFQLASDNYKLAAEAYQKVLSKLKEDGGDSDEIKAMIECLEAQIRLMKNLAKKWKNLLEATKEWDIINKEETNFKNAYKELMEKVFPAYEKAGGSSGGKMAGFYLRYKRLNKAIEEDQKLLKEKDCFKKIMEGPGSGGGTGEDNGGTGEFDGNNGNHLPGSASIPESRMFYALSTEVGVRIGKNKQLYLNTIYHLSRKTGIGIGAAYGRFTAAANREATYFRAASEGNTQAGWVIESQEVENVVRTYQLSLLLEQGFVNRPSWNLNLRGGLSWNRYETSDKTPRQEEFLYLSPLKNRNSDWAINMSIDTGIRINRRIEMILSAGAVLNGRYQGPSLASGFRLGIF